MSRVLVVTNDFPTRRGGIESFVLALCERMDPAEVVVYTASMPGDRDYDARLPFPVYRDPTSVLLPTPAVARRVVAVMRRHGCDRVVFGASAPLGLLAPRLRRAGARRIVALTHGHEVWWARVPVTRRLLRRIGDSVDVMTYVSEWCRARIASALSPAAAARMQRLSPGVDPERFYPGCGGAEVRRRLGIPADAPVVVCTARFVRRKGQDTLVRAWPQGACASFPDARLLLVGDGPDRARVERMVRRRKLAEVGDLHRQRAVGGSACLHRRRGCLRDAVPDAVVGLGGGGLGDRVPGGAGVRAAGRHRKIRGRSGSTVRRSPRRSAERFTWRPNGFGRRRAHRRRSRPKSHASWTWDGRRGAPNMLT